MDRNWALREVYLAFNKVDYLLFSYFKSTLRIIGQQLTYWSNGIHTFEESSRSFWAYQWPFTWYSDCQSFLNFLDDSVCTISPWDLRNGVACNEEPHTMHGAHHSACFGCVHEQFRCKRPHQVLGIPWVWSAMYRECMHSLWESRKLRKKGNARINKVLAMRPGLAKIIQKLRISRHFKSPETDLHIGEIAWCIEYTDTWSSKRVHWLSKRQSTNRSTPYEGCEKPVEFDTGVAWASLLITRIHPQVAHISKIQWLLPTLYNTRWMDLRQVRHGTYKAIPILDPVNVKEAYGYSASCHHCLLRRVRSYGWCYVSFSQKEDSKEGKLILRHGVCTTDAVKTLWWSNLNDRYMSHCRKFALSYPKVAII